MNHRKSVLFIILSIIAPLSNAVAGEFTVYTDRGELKCFEQNTVIEPAPVWKGTLHELQVYDVGGVKSFNIRGSEITVSTNQGVKKLVFPDPYPTWVKSPWNLTFIRLEGTTIYYNPDSTPQKTAYKDNWKFVGERCISNCDEGKVTPRVRSNLPEENYVEEGGITITITQGEAEMKSDRGGPSLIPTFKGEKPLKPPHGEWQIPVFKEERKARGGEEAEDVPSGAFNPRTGQYYPSTGEGAFDPKTGQYFPPTGGGYFNPRTGEFYPKTGGK